MIRREHRDPKGGLNASGRAAYNKEHGSNLKPGVKGKANTPEKMRRKGSWAVRFYGRSGDLPPLKKPNGEPTRFALTAAAWGEPVPETEAEARAIGAKGRELLKRYREHKGAGAEGTTKEAADLMNETEDRAVDFSVDVPGSGIEKETGQAEMKPVRTTEGKAASGPKRSAAKDKAVSFVEGLKKTASLTPKNRKLLYKTLEYGGLGTLGAVDAHEAYKAHKEGDKGARNKALVGTAALGALIGATRLANH